MQEMNHLLRKTDCLRHFSFDDYEAILIAMAIVDDALTFLLLMMFLEQNLVNSVVMGTYA